MYLNLHTCTLIYYIFVWFKEKRLDKIIRFFTSCMLLSCVTCSHPQGCVVLTKNHLIEKSVRFLYSTGYTSCVARYKIVYFKYIHFICTKCDAPQNLLPKTGDFFEASPTLGTSTVYNFLNFLLLDIFFMYNMLRTSPPFIQPTALKRHSLSDLHVVQNKKIHIILLYYLETCVSLKRL